ncbi:MAG TPA: S-layer homology domain-containing protein [Candidatus Baltobacteraceae bacterium]|nr:S-layer homology domain-containing protein [Candidatus Baltobacteraceae bacterium]
MRNLKAVWLVAAATIALNAGPAFAQSGDSLKDVPQNHWAYKAVTQLQQDGIVEGYPDGYFKGQRPLTRYELAVVVARAVSKLESELASANSAPKVKPEDIAALRKLVDEYGTELKDVQKDVADLKTQVATNTATLDRQQFHLYYFLRAPGAFQELASVYGPNGLGVQEGQNFLARNSGGSNIGATPQTLVSGVSAHGTAYQVLRLVFSGNVDPKVSYAVRLEDRYYLDGTTNNVGNSAAGVVPGPNSNYPNNSLLRINYANVTYKDPSGFKATAGRFLDASGDIGLAWNDYFNGVRVGYDKDAVKAYAFYSWNTPSANNTVLSNINLNAVPSGGLVTNNPWQTVGARVAYELKNANNNNNGHIGASIISDINPPGIGYYNNGFLITQLQNVPVGSIDASWTFNKAVQLQVEGIHRFGKDPSTGANWTDANAAWGKLFLGPTAPKSGNANIELGLIGVGENSVGLHNEINGTTDYQQLYFNGNPSGYQIGYGGVNYYFGTGAKVSLIYQGYRINPSANLTSLQGPTSGPSAGVCNIAAPDGAVVNAGCYATHDDGRAIFLQTLLSF